MTYRGRIENGQVVIDEQVNLPNGTAVTVSVAPDSVLDDEESNGPTLLDTLKDFVGTAKNLPPDASINVDHYLYGHPKK